MDRLLIKSNASQILVGTSSWREQFAEAIKIQVDDDDEGEDDKEEKDKDKEKKGEEGGGGGGEGEAQEEKEEKRPSVSDYIIHFVSLFWKILFAFVPPTG